MLTTSGKKGLSIHLEQWMKEFKGAMFLVGASTIRELQRAQINRV